MKIILLALMLTGCAIDSRYTWILSNPASTQVEWVTVSKPDLYRNCGYSTEQIPDLYACAFQNYETGECVIFSVATEAVAQQILTGQYDIATHERRHCAGWRHQSLVNAKWE